MSFDQDSQDFVTSLIHNNSQLLTEKFAVHDYRSQNQGRGLIALQDIKQGEDIFKIPRSYVLNLDTCSLSDAQKLVLNKLGQWELLIVIIFYERSLGINSKWHHYFKILPFDQTFNNLMFWSDEELLNLQPSLVVSRIGKAEAEQMFAKLFPDVIQELGIYENLKDVTVDQFHRVASTIMSYSFDVEHAGAEDDDDEEEEEEEFVEEDEDDDNDVEPVTDITKEGYFKSMVPLADTLNADTNLCNANLVYTAEFLVMRASSDIKKGDQIYNTYANHPNSEILRRYGYVEFGGSKHDFGELRFDDIVAFFKETYGFADKLMKNIVDLVTDNEYLLELTEGQNIVLDTYDCYSDGEVYPELILLLQIFTVLGLLNQQDKKLLKRMLKSELDKFLHRNIKKNYQLVEQKKLMKTTVENFHKIMDLRILQYPEGVMDLEVVEDYTNREAMARCVLQSEYRSLTRLREQLLSSFEAIEDDKMIKNVLKRKLEEDAEKLQKKRR